MNGLLQEKRGRRENIQEAEAVVKGETDGDCGDGENRRGWVWRPFG